MAYQIRKYNGDVLLTLEDGHTDSAYSSLTLIGKNVTNFGSAQNENIIHLLENFSSNTAPASQLQGQLWYDNSQYKLKVWNGGGWVELAQIDYTGTEPTASRAGQLWFNTDTSQLYMNVGISGNDFKFIGPDLVPGAGVTRMVSTSLSSASVLNPNIPVINITVNGEVVGIISTTTFTLNQSIAGFSTNQTINRGINLINQDTDTTNFQLYGRSSYSNLASVATNISGGKPGQVVYQTDSGSTGYTNTGTAGALLVSAGGGQPLFVNNTNITVGYSNTATNLSGGSQGSFPYQTAGGSTTQLSLGLSTYILTAGATAPVWSSPSSVAVGYSTTAGQADKLKDSASSNYYSASVTALSNSMVQRSSDGNIFANTFTGDLIGNVTGIASTAVKLQTPRSITLTGATAGTVTFDGSSDVTITTTANSAFSQGMIIMWAGSSGSIPLGWLLCDGTNGTPNLRDKFIIGSGGQYATGSNGGSNSLTLTVDNLPAHQHNFDTPYSLDSSGSGVFDRSGNRLTRYDGNGETDSGAGNAAWYYGKTALAGGNVSATPINLMPSYYALAFIMKT